MMSASARRCLPSPARTSRSTIAALADGTPLVTRAARGAGQVVLFHVTANAEWSNLPLSGLFVSMLERWAVSTRGAVPQAGELAGTHWQPEEVLDAFGLLARADDRPAVAGGHLAPLLAGTRAPGADLPPGLYAGAAMRLAVNATTAQTPLAAAQWPLGTALDTGFDRPEAPLAGYLFALAAGGLDAGCAGDAGAWRSVVARGASAAGAGAGRAARRGAAG